MPAWTLRQSTNWRVVRLFVLALILFAGGAAALHLSIQLKQHADSMTRYVRVDAWGVQQLEYHTQLFRALVARHVAGDAAVTRKAMRQSLAKAKATIPLLKQGKDYEDFRLLIDIDGTAATVAQAFDRIDSILAQDKSVRGDLVTLQLVEEVLSSPTRRLHQLAIDLAHVRAELQDGDLANVQWLTGINRWMLIAFGPVLVVFIGFLISEIRSAKLAERTAIANEQETRYVAEHDQLTGLINRTKFTERVERLLQEIESDSQQFAVFLIDLARFKDVNDTLGHAIGDELLQKLANRLTEQLPGRATLARFGGDTFIVLLTDIHSMRVLEDFANFVLDEIQRPFEVEDLTLEVDASIGAAIFPTHGNQANGLIQRADIALNLAKRDKVGYAIYSPEEDVHSIRNLTLTGDLRQAIESGNLELAFQPKVCMRNRWITGLEVLARWPHPTHGYISPEEFVANAEQTGLILPMTNWVLNKALGHATEWRKAGHNLNIAVNLSARLLHNPAIIPTVSMLLKKWEYPAELLTLEITENALVVNPEQAMQVVKWFAELGMHVSIDDFGTGYSSLAYLKNLPVHELKIDKTFVFGLTSDESDRKIVKSVIAMAHDLELAVVAEGIEDMETLTALGRLDCDIGQGYLFGKPMARDDFERWLSESEWRRQTLGKNPDNRQIPSRRASGS